MFTQNNFNTASTQMPYDAMSLVIDKNAEMLKKVFPWLNSEILDQIKKSAIQESNKPSNVTQSEPTSDKDILACVFISLFIVGGYPPALLRFTKNPNRNVGLFETNPNIEIKTKDQAIFCLTQINNLVKLKATPLIDLKSIEAYMVSQTILLDAFRDIVYELADKGVFYYLKSYGKRPVSENEKNQFNLSNMDEIDQTDKIHPMEMDDITDAIEGILFEFPRYGLISIHDKGLTNLSDEKKKQTLEFLNAILDSAKIKLDTYADLEAFIKMDLAEMATYLDAEKVSSQRIMLGIDLLEYIEQFKRSKRFNDGNTDAISIDGSRFPNAPIRLFHGGHSESNSLGLLINTIIDGFDENKSTLQNAFAVHLGLDMRSLPQFNN